MTFLNRRLFDNVSVFVDSLSGANRVAFDVNKPNGILTLAISGNIVGDNVKVGTGSPEGAVVGKVGDVYQRKDGGANTSLYIKESGSGNTGWTALGAPVSGGGSLSGGIKGRAAIWGTSSSISASHIISEGSDELTIRGTTIVTTAKADGSTWNSIIIRDGMEGGVNDTGDHPGSRILYESSDGPNPYRASIEFGVNLPGMDSESRMVLGTQRAYYDPIIPGITIVGGTVSNGGSVYIKTSESLPNNLGETVQISGSILTSEEITARDGIIVSSSSSPTVQLKTSNAEHTVENLIAELGFSSNTIGSSMPVSGARIITYGNTPLIIKTKFAENPAGNSAIFNTTGNLLLKTNADNNVDTLQVSGGAAISGALVSFNLRRGTGSPEGVVTATLGTIYQRTDGGPSTSVYIKETNTGNTGWTAIAPGVSGGSSLSGGTAGRAAIWSGTTNVSASSTIIESSGRVLIGGNDNGSDKLQVTGSAGISGWMVSSNIKRGVGSPEGFVTGNIGDMYQRTDGIVGGTIYMKETGSGNTGWIGIQSTTGAITASSVGASGLLSIYNRNFSLVDYYTKNAATLPNTLSGTYTLGAQFVPTRNITIYGVRVYTAQTTGSMTAKLWRTGTTTALASAVSTIPTSGYYEVRFPSPYIISNTDINYEFYATILTSGNLYTRTVATNTRVGTDPINLYQEPGVVLRSNAMSWWVASDNIPTNTSASERYPVEPIIDMTLATFSGLTTGTSSQLSGGVAGRAAIWSGTNSISASSLITELSSEVRIASPVTTPYIIAGESSATTASPRRILMGYDSVGSGRYSIQPVHQSIAWTNLSLNELGGNVLIGATTDNALDKLQVVGWLSSKAENSSSYGIVSVRNSSGTRQLEMVAPPTPDSAYAIPAGYAGFNTPIGIGITLGTGDTPRAAITSGGNFIIGPDTATGELLRVGGTARVLQTLSVSSTGSGQVTIQLQSVDAQQSVLSFYNASSSHGYALYRPSSSTDLRFYQSGTINGDAVTLKNNGNVLIGTTTDNGIDRLQISGSAGISGALSAQNIKRGTGSPEGVTTGNIGDVYQRVDGSTGTTFYVKESGTGNTGWTAVSAGSSLSGGTAGRAAFWSGSNSISACSFLTEEPVRMRVSKAFAFDRIPNLTQSISGDFYYNQTMRAFIARTGGYDGYSDNAAYALQSVRYSAGGRYNINNTASEVTLSDQNVGAPSSSNRGDLSLHPNYWVGGKRIKITAYGVIQNTGTPTLRLRVKENNSGTILHDTGDVTMSTITARRHWECEYYIHCLSVSGTAANLITNGKFLYGTTANAALTCINVGTSIPVSVPYDIEGSYIVTSQFGTASTSNGITANDYFIEEIG